MNHGKVKVICYCTDTGQARVMDESQGQISLPGIKQEQEGQAKGGRRWRAGMGVCVNDMVICTHWSSDVIKAMI